MLYHTAILILVILQPSVDNQHLSLDELLLELEKAQLSVQKRHELGFISRELTDTAWDEPDLSEQTYELHTDGNSHKLKFSRWMSTNHPDETSGDGDKYEEHLWNKDIWYLHDVGRRQTYKNNRLVIFDMDKHKSRNLYNKYYGGALDFYFTGDNDMSVLDIIKEAENVEMSQKKEDNDGGPYYVIDAKSKYGRHKIWLDSSKGYHISQAEITKEGNDLMFGTPLSEYAKDRMGYPNLKKYRFLLYDVQFKRVDGAYVAVSSRLRKEYVLNNGKTNIDSLYHVREQVEVNPDFESINAFELSVLDGTQVHYFDDKGKSLVHWKWENGAVVKDIDDLVVAEIDKMADEILHENTVTSNLRDVNNAETDNRISDGNESDQDTGQLNNIEIQHGKTSGKTNSFPILLAVSIGLPLACAAAWFLYRKTKLGHGE